MNDNRFQRKIKIALVAVLVIALCFGAIFYLQYKAALKNPKNNVTYQNSDEELGINPEVSKQLKDYRCMALYGIDDEGISGVMIVAAVNWDTHQVKIFKVDSKTYMELSDSKKFVINGDERTKFACGYTYSRAGLVSSIKMLNRHLDLNIREGIGMNLEAVKKIVDDLGGIEIAMSQSMCDSINSQFNHPGKIKVKNGKAKLNGQGVIEYLAAYSDSDTISDADAMGVYSVFISMLSKAKENDENNLLKILNTAYRGCSTNMTVKDLAVFVKEIDTYEAKGTPSWPYKYKQKTIGGQKVLVPNTLSSNVSKLHKEVFNQNNYKPTKTCERLSTHNK